MYRLPVVYLRQYTSNGHDHFEFGSFKERNLPASRNRVAFCAEFLVDDTAGPSSRLSHSLFKCF